MNLSISNKILLGKLVPENQWLETWSHLEMKETLKQSFNVLRFQGQFSGLNNTPWKTNITFSHLKLSQKPPKKGNLPKVFQPIPCFRCGYVSFSAFWGGENLHPCGGWFHWGRSWLEALSHRDLRGLVHELGRLGSLGNGVLIRRGWGGDWGFQRGCSYVVTVFVW